jgi:hypothetical protein
MPFATWQELVAEVTTLRRDVDRLTVYNKITVALGGSTLTVLLILAAALVRQALG